MTKDQAGFGLTDFGIGETLIADKCPKGGPCDAYAPYRYAQCTVAISCTFIFCFVFMYSINEILQKKQMLSFQSLTAGFI